MGVVAAAFLLAGCAALEPGVYDPDLDDAKLSLHLLRSQNREAQRMMAELRAELDASRQSLAASEVARARLEGQLREAQRRYDESRQVVELQREELARLRDEREQVLHASQRLQAQMSQVQRQLASLGAARKARSSRPPEGAQAVRASDEGGGEEPMRATVAAQDGAEDEQIEPSPSGTRADGEIDGAFEEPGIVVVQKGDTLWSLARRYRVSLAALLQANGITNPDRIFAGQELLLPE